MLRYYIGMKQQTLPDGALEVATEAAQKAGELQKRLLIEGFRVDRKSTSVDMVTEADKKSEQIIRSVITSRFPDHDILGEEEGSTVCGSQWQWIIDPLDGTTNYVHHHPIFCVSVALTFQGVPMLGVVYAPMLDDLYSAVAGEGALKNGIPIRVSKRRILNETLMATGVPYDRATSSENNIDYLADMSTKVRGIRRLGAAAYDLCLVAEGVYDAYWELKIRSWDIAAGSLIVKEAGGFAVHWHHGGTAQQPALLDCLVASPAILPPLLEALSETGSAYSDAKHTGNELF
ncbi:inositol monophosphatase [Sediminispirochaeta smaragdinae DSM 11293]|uniref:Inositol-1-monophosphatase n=2 Tax=Sediminispirochaeta TaxID=1911556 RepID=E1R7M8_SEDSS|nr:inositol monophosphatase [Sediminispirochaeta smaragdinae DSM 11293]